jgi:hypothetical protein
MTLNIDSKKILKINFWMGILIFSLPLVASFIAPSHSNFDYELVRTEYMKNHYLWYKIGGVTMDFSTGDGWAGAAAIVLLFFIFYILFFILYFLFFIKSYYSINKIGFESRIAIRQTKLFFIGSLLLYFFVIITGSGGNHSNDLSDFKYWIIAITLYIFGFLFCQKVILNYFRCYVWLYIALCIVPIIILVVFKEMTLLDYQFLFFVNNDIIESKWLYAIVVLSPFSYLSLPLFFSFNHYIITKKLVLENTKEPLPENFYDFKFNYENRQPL